MSHSSALDRSVMDLISNNIDGIIVLDACAHNSLEEIRNRSINL